MYITLAPFSKAFIPSVDASDVLPVEQSPTMNIFCLFKAKSNSFSLDICHLRPSVILVSSNVSCFSLEAFLISFNLLAFLILTSSSNILYKYSLLDIVSSFKSNVLLAIFYKLRIFANSCISLASASFNHFRLLKFLTENLKLCFTI